METTKVPGIGMGEKDEKEVLPTDAKDPLDLGLPTGGEKDMDLGIKDLGDKDYGDKDLFSDGKKDMSQGLTGVEDGEIDEYQLCNKLIRDQKGQTSNEPV